MTSPAMRTKGLRVVLGASYPELAAEFSRELQEVRAGSLDELLDPEWVVTPSLGTKSWLTNELLRASSDGDTKVDVPIIANWVHDFPASLATRVLDAHRKATTGEEYDPWSLPHLALELFSLANDETTNGSLPTDSPCSPLADASGTPSFERARHYADLFDHYHVWRRDLIRGWAEGRSLTSQDEERRQSALWRALRARPLMQASPPERWSAAYDRLADGWAAGAPVAELGLPTRRRLSVFGLTAFPGTAEWRDGAWHFDFVSSLVALAELMPVTVYLLSSFEGDPLDGVTSRYEFSTQLMKLWGGLPVANHPVVDALCEAAGTSRPSRPVSSAPTTLLGAMQHVLRSDREAVAAEPDHSIVEHWCYGPSRQVDALHDAIRHDLNAHRDWTEGDLLVVCPDLDTYAPLIRAAFGASRRDDARGGDGETPRLAYRVVNPSTTSDGLYLQGVRHLLNVVKGRLGRSEVLSLLAEPTAMAALRFTDENLETFTRWCRQAGIRWGYDLEHRESFGLKDGVDAQTWRRGLARLILGTMVHHEDLRDAKGLLPVEIPAGQLDLFHRFARVVDTLGTNNQMTRSTATLAEWLRWFDQLVATFVRPLKGDRKEYERVRRALEPLFDAAEVFATTTLQFRDVAALLDEALQLSGSAGGLFTGAVTVTTPDTLRWVPHKSIYLLGFDDDAFLRADWTNDDLRRHTRDVGADRPRPGDLAPSDDGRSRLVELFLAAGEKVTVFRTSRDVTTNRKVDPCVTYAEYRDAVTRLAPAGSSLPLVVQHRRQNFDAANFRTDGQLGEATKALYGHDDPWSFDQRAFSLAQATVAAQAERASEVTGSGGAPVLGPVAEPIASTVAFELLGSQLDVSSLIKFLKDPCAEHVRVTLGVDLNRWEDRDTDDLAVDLSKAELARFMTSLPERELKTGVERARVVSLLAENGEIPPADLVRPQLNDAAISELKDLLSSTVASMVPERLDRRVSLASLYDEVKDHPLLAELPFEPRDWGNLELTGTFEAFVHRDATTDAASAVHFQDVQAGKFSSSSSVAAARCVQLLFARAVEDVDMVSFDCFSFRTDEVATPVRGGFLIDQHRWEHGRDHVAEAKCHLLALATLYLQNVAEPIAFEVKHSYVEKDGGLLISEEDWRAEGEHGGGKFLGRSSWRFVFGDAPVQALFRRDGDSPTGIRRVGPYLVQLLKFGLLSNRRVKASSKGGG